MLSVRYEKVKEREKEDANVRIECGIKRRGVAAKLVRRRLLLLLLLLLFGVGEGAFSVGCVVCFGDVYVDVVCVSQSAAEGASVSSRSTSTSLLSFGT